MSQNWLRRMLIGAVAVLLLGDVVGLAAMPSGAKTVAGVVPDGSRILITRSVGEARILVLRERSDLRLLVAYKQRGRWRSVRVERERTATAAAWAATQGAGPVPSFSAVYGAAEADKAVVVRWQDGEASPVVPVNGAYLAVRRGHVRPTGVEINPAPAP